MKKFNQSPNKFILDSLIVFGAVTFFVFFLSYVFVENIRYITVFEIFAAIGTGLSLSIIYAVITQTFKQKKYVYIDKDSIIIDCAGKQKIVKFSKLNTLDVFSGLFYRLFGSIKVRVEARECFYTFLISKAQLDDFLDCLPKNLNLNNGGYISTGSVWLNLLSQLLRLTFLFIFGAAFVLPGLLQMVKTSDWHFIWYSFLILYLSLFCLLSIIFFIKITLYQNLKYKIENQNLSVKSGRFLKRQFTLLGKSITCVVFVHNFFSRIFNLYKIKLLTKGGGKGVIETTYFPFMLNKKVAIEIMQKLVGEAAISQKLEKPKLKTIVPTIVLWLIPAIGIEAIGMLGSNLFRLLYIPIMLFVLITFSNNCRNFDGDYFIIQKGFINTMRYFIPKDKIERLDAFQTITCRIFKMTFIEICLSGYRSVIFGGYFYKFEYDKFVEKTNKLD